MNYCYRFPVVKGLQAGRTYYIAMVPLKALSKLFPDDEDFVLCHPTCELAKLIAEDFDESIALELGKVLISLYNR